jgi:hypothetical protein
MKILPVYGLLLLIGLTFGQQSGEWTQYVRTSGHGLNADNIDVIIQSAKASGLFGIEVDNDITGRYDSFLDPTDKLEVLKKLADAAHAADNYAFVYIAGLECITSDADEREHTFFKDHPDWVQRDIDGRPAVFGGGSAFWIREGDEDVWISPYAVEWRKIYMRRVRQIAATGIDGIYVDIPYWMTHFEGWEDTWASLDDYTVTAFKQRTGYDALTGMTLGDFSDPVFRKWVDFRITTIVEFMAEIRSEVRTVNPDCKVIAEIYPGIDESAVRVGADVYALYPVVDAICHEFSEGAYMAAGRKPVDWLRYMAGMYTFRAFAEDKPTWMLSYSWNGHDAVDPADAMKNLFTAQVMAGANVWDARGEVMSGSNDLDTRTRVFNWIASNQVLLYSERKPISPVGIYFSPATRNYDPDAFYQSFMGAMLYVMRRHMEFQVVTPRNILDFSGDLLILPEVRVIDELEGAHVLNMARSGKQIIWSGKPDSSDIHAVRQLRKNLEKYQSYFILNGAPFREIFRLLVEEQNLSSEPFTTIDATIRYISKIRIEAPPFVVSQIAQVQDRPVIFLSNFSGLVPDRNAVPVTVTDVVIRFPGKMVKSVTVIPFLGIEELLPLIPDGQDLKCIVPDLKNGAVIRLE